MQEESIDAPFSVHNVEHDLLQKYKPRFTGVGGYQVVYDVPKHPSVVIKVEANRMLEYAESGFTDSDIQRDLTLSRARTKRLREHFGNEHTLPQRFFVMNVPVDERLYNELRDKFRPGKSEPTSLPSNELQAVVSVQKKEEQLRNPERRVITCDYAETSDKSSSPQFVADYDQVTSQTVFNPESRESMKLEDLIRLYPGLAEILSAAQNDTSCRDTVKDFVEKAISFAEEHGEILDIVGDDNVIFTQGKNGEWDYKLVDALFPAPPPPNGRLSEAKDILEKIQNDQLISERERRSLINTLNFTRAINGLASCLEVDNRIDITPPENVPIPTGTLLETVRGQT
jgi:hypothetical protein